MTIKKVCSYYLPCCCYHVMWHSNYMASVVTSLPFINPLPRPRGIVNRPSNAHFKIMVEVVHLFEYSAFGHSTFLTYCFFTYYIVGKYAISDAVIVYSKYRYNILLKNTIRWKDKGNKLYGLFPTILSHLCRYMIPNTSQLLFQHLWETAAVQ